MKLIETINDLVSARKKRQQEIKAAVYNVLYALGELVCDSTEYRISCERQIWSMQRIFLSPGNDIHIEVVQSDNQGSIGNSYILGLEDADEEDVLYAVYGLLAEMGSEEINSRLLETSAELAITGLMKKYGLPEKDFYAGKNLKPEYQDEFSKLCLENTGKLSN